MVRNLSFYLGSSGGVRGVPVFDRLQNAAKESELKSASSRNLQTRVQFHDWPWVEEIKKRDGADGVVL